MMESLKQWLINGLTTLVDKASKVIYGDFEHPDPDRIKVWVDTKRGVIVTDLKSLLNSKGFKKQCEAARKIFERDE